MRKLSIVFLLPLMGALACMSTRITRRMVAPPDNCDGIKDFFQIVLEPYEDAVDEASKNYQVAQWLVETADPKADPKKMSALFNELQQKTYNNDVLERTKMLEEATRGLKPEVCAFRPRVVRARWLLETSILTNPIVVKMEKENQDRQDAMIAKSNAFRMQLPGEKEPVSRAIYQKKLGSTDNRRERETLFKRFNPARAVEWLNWGFRDLVRSRNDEARLAGYKDYYEYRFFRNQLDLKNYREMVEEVKAKLAPKVRKELKLLARTAHIRKLEGWDLRYLRDKAASGEVNRFLANVPATTPLAIAKRFYGALGFNIDDYHFLMDLFPKPGKNTHAFAMPVVLPHVDAEGRVLPMPKPDIRFLANMKQPVQWDDISTVIHELGHAVHAAEVRQPIGLFRGIGSVETEAIAITMQRMANSVEFQEATLPEFTGLPAEQLIPILKKQVRSAKLEQAFLLLRQVFFSDFEYEMYKNPDADFAALWSKMHKEYWGVDIAPGEADWDVEHYLMAPVYIENYAIGILMVEQLYESMLGEFHTGYNSKPLGEKLRKVYFSPGEEFDYLGLTQRFSGKPLTAKAALRLLD